MARVESSAWQMRGGESELMLSEIATAGNVSEVHGTSGASAMAILEFVLGAAGTVGLHCFRNDFAPLRISDENSHRD